MQDTPMHCLAERQNCYKRHDNIKHLAFVEIVIYNFCTLTLPKISDSLRKLSNIFAFTPMLNKNNSATDSDRLGKHQA